MATEKRFINANEMLRFVENEIDKYEDALNKWERDYAKSMKATAKLLRVFPTVDAVEVVHGRWIDEYPYVRCSECNAEWFNCRTDNDPKIFYYCPNCGTDMRERGEVRND